jgi:hypothetical protein
MNTCLAFFFGPQGTLEKIAAFFALLDTRAIESAAAGSDLSLAGHTLSPEQLSDVIALLKCHVDSQGKLGTPAGHSETDGWCAAKFSVSNSEVAYATGADYQIHSTDYVSNCVFVMHFALSERIWLDARGNVCATFRVMESTMWPIVTKLCNGLGIDSITILIADTVALSGHAYCAGGGPHSSTYPFQAHFDQGLGSLFGAGGLGQSGGLLEGVGAIVCSLGVAAPLFKQVGIDTRFRVPDPPVAGVCHFSSIYGIKKLSLAQRIIARAMGMEEHMPHFAVQDTPEFDNAVGQARAALASSPTLQLAHLKSTPAYKLALREVAAKESQTVVWWLRMFLCAETSVSGASRAQLEDGARAAGFLDARVMMVMALTERLQELQAAAAAAAAAESAPQALAGDVLVSHPGQAYQVPLRDVIRSLSGTTTVSRAQSRAILASNTVPKHTSRDIEDLIVDFLDHMQCESISSALLYVRVRVVCVCVWVGGCARMSGRVGQVSCATAAHVPI